MEASSWRPAQGEPSAAAATGEAPSGDWRAHLQNEARTRIVNKIMETLKRHLPVSPVPEGLNELQKIAIRFEEKIYSAATSQSDYLRKISLKMLSMESKTQHPAPINSSMSNGGINNQNPADPASLGMPQQVNQGQFPMINQTPARQQIFQSNIQNSTSSAIQGSPNISSALPTVAGLNQSTITGVGQASNLQNMSGISHNNSGSSSIGQTVTPDIYANAQRQMQGRQQQHQSQNQTFYQQQIQQQLLKQKLQQSSLLQQQQPQQQSLLQTTQFQSSQQPLMQMSSSLQSGQSSVSQTQPGVMQSAVQSGLQQSQLNSVQQPVPSLLQQHSQSIARQQQQVQSAMHQQTASLQQQPTSVTQQTSLPLQQHQPQLMGSQAISNIQQSQLLGQQTSITDMQQLPRRMAVQQNNLLSIQQSQQILNQHNISLHQQQQLGPQSNISGLQQQQQQQQQQQVLGSLPGVSNIQSQQRSMHVLQQSKAVAQQQQHQQQHQLQQQQNQQSSMAAMQPQGQQSQHQSPQQQVMSQFQSQQHLTMQQHSNALQREMHQRIQASGALLSQNAIEQQKQFVQSQIGLPDVSSSTSGDSTAQTGNPAVVDWQEEIYQKIKSMKELYFTELNELYQRIAMKLQQHDANPPPVKQAEQYEKMKSFKYLLERILHTLQLPKGSIQPGLKDRIHVYEKQITSILASHKKKPPGVQQLQHSGGHAQSLPQQQPSQVSQIQQHDSSMNQVQQINLQSSSNSMQSAAVPSSQLGSMPLSSQFGMPTTQQNLTNALPPTSTMDQIQGNSFNSLQQGAISSMQQGGAVSGQSTNSGPQQTNVNNLSHNSTSIQNNINSLQVTSNTPQQQILKQHQQQLQEQHHRMQSQQMKQLQQHHMQQQPIQQQQKQQLLQTQQPLQQQQQKQQQTTQMPPHQLPQLHQTTETNDLNMRQGTGMKPGLYQQHYSGSQRHNFYQQFKPGAAFPITSPQNLQASSPQISHHSSPQIDQHSLLSSQLKSRTHLQSSNSPFSPSPSTPLAPSPIPGDTEKPLSGITSLSNAGHVGMQQSSHGPSQVQSLAVATPGMSASPLLAEFTVPDGNQSHQTNLPTTTSGRTSAAERPLDRLLKLVQSSSPKILSSAINDIGSVVSMIDRIAGSAPGNGSRTAVGEDLVAMTKCRLQARNFISQDGSATTKKMKRDTSAMPLNNVSSAGSVNDNFASSYGLETAELESTATSRVKRHKVEVNHALLEEIREINQQLIDTVVKISEDDSDSTLAASESEGTLIKCSFMAVALSPSLKTQFASAQLSPILPLKLFVPANYPKSSPVLLDKLPDEPSRESDDLSTKAKLRFSISLRSLSQPMSLGEMARTWDACARKVIAEYAQQVGGGTFSSSYGGWENCVGA